MSNLSYLSKLLEAIVLHQLVEQVFNNDLFEVELKQSTYHQYYSTETALLHVISCPLSNTDHRQVSILTLLKVESDCICCLQDNQFSPLTDLVVRET